MKEIKKNECFKYSDTVGKYQLSNQIRLLINAINFVCLFVIYPFACYGMLLILRGLYLCDISKMIDSGLVLDTYVEMMFRGLTNVLLLLILFPFVLLFINYLWKHNVKSMQEE